MQSTEVQSAKPRRRHPALATLKDVLTYYRVLRNHEVPNVHIDVVSDEQKKIHAQLLHAEVYRRIGFIRDSDIGEDGRLKLSSDPHQLHSIYFTVTDKSGNVLALSRQIRNKPGRGFDSFPVLEKSQIYPSQLRAIKAGDPEKCVEISALVKRRGQSALLPLMLYRKMFEHSRVTGDEIWLMACDIRLFERLKLLFGPAIVQIGSRTEYLGGDVIPAKINLADSIKQLKSSARDKVPFRRSIRKSILKFMLS